MKFDAHLECDGLKALLTHKLFGKDDRMAPQSSKGKTRGGRERALPAAMEITLDLAGFPALVAPS